MTRFTVSFRICLLLALAVIGCSDSPTGPPSQSSPPKAGDLSVSIYVTGDPSLGPSAFRILVDGSEWGVAQPNETQTQKIDAGPHVIHFAPLAPSVVCFGRACWYPLEAWLNSWCRLAGTDRQSVVVTGGGVQSVTFGFDCPPLVGEGNLEIGTVAMTGTSIPPDFTAVITRMRGPAFSRTVKLPANGSATFAVPVGVYNLTILPGPTCEQTTWDIFASSSHAIVRDGGEVRTWQIITCD